MALEILNRIHSPRLRKSKAPRPGHATRSARHQRSKVLVFGDDTRSFLAIVRSLGRKGIEVHAAPLDFLSPALASRYVSQIHTFPAYIGDGRDWIDAVGAVVKKEHFDLIIPCDERTLIPLYRHRAALGIECPLSVPDERAFEALFDKYNTKVLAHSSGMPVAQGRLVESDDTPEKMLGEFGLPLVLKPRRSFSEVMLYSRASVKVVHKREDLPSAISEAIDKGYLVEEYYDGYGVGLSVLAKGGRILQAFQHLRVHETSGGSSGYRVSAAVDPEMLAACGRMLERIRYTGLAMFEFKKNRVSGRWVLLEVNARPWGSLPLPVSVGVDFPYFLYRLLVDGVEEPRAAYRNGVYGRNILMDFHWMVGAARKLYSESPEKLPAFASVSVAEFLRILIGREASDTFVVDDFGPGIAECAAVARWKFSGIMRKSSARRRRAGERAADILSENPNGFTEIVFVCHGNICRSPFAAAAMRAMLPASLRHISVVSAGILPIEDRTSPETAVEAAHSLGVDLKEHRSRFLSRDMLDSASLLVVFDRRNESSIRARYPDLNVPLFYFGEISGDNFPHEIADPYGRNFEDYRRTYQIILGGLAALLGRMTNDQIALPGFADILRKEKLQSARGREDEQADAA